MQEFGLEDFLGMTLEQSAGLDAAAEKAPITVHQLALEFSDDFFGKPSQRSAAAQQLAENFIEKFLEEVSPELLDLHHEDALREQLLLTIKPFYHAATRTSLDNHVSEMIDVIDHKNAENPKNRWDVMRDSLRPSWEKKLLNTAKRKDALNEHNFAEQALTIIHAYAEETNAPDSITWRNQGMAERMLRNLYTLSLADGVNLNSALKRIEQWTDTPLPKQAKDGIMQAFLEQKMAEPYFSTIMALPNTQERLKALGPVADQLMQGSHESLKDALEALDKAYAATKEFGKAQRAKAVLKWGQEHIENFERSMLVVAMIGTALLTARQTTFSSTTASQNAPIDIIQDANKKMGQEREALANAAREKSSTSEEVIAAVDSSNYWRDKVPAKQKTLHEKINAKVEKFVDNVKVVQKKVDKMIGMQTSKHAGDYMDAHTVSYTSQRLGRCVSEPEMVDIFMDKWLLEVEDFQAYSYGDGMKSKTFPNGIPTIGFGFNLARSNAYETTHKVLGWDRDEFDAHVKNFAKKDHAGKKPITMEEATKLARNDAAIMLRAVKKELGQECWANLNWHQKFTALDLFYNNPGTQMGKETVELFQETARTGNAEKLAQAVADKRNASDIAGSNLRRKVNAEFILGEPISLKSKALVRQILAPELKRAKNGAEVMVEISDEKRAPKISHIKKFVKLPANVEVTVIPVISTQINGINCKIPCGEKIVLTGTGNGVKAEALPVGQMPEAYSLTAPTAGFQAKIAEAETYKTSLGQNR